MKHEKGNISPGAGVPLPALSTRCSLTSSCLAEAQWLCWQVLYMYQLCMFKFYSFSCSLTKWTALLLYFKNKHILHEALRQAGVFYACTSVLYKHKYAMAIQEVLIHSHPWLHLTPETRPYNLICKLLFNRDIRNALHKAPGQMDSWKSRLSSQFKHHDQKMLWELEKLCHEKKKK